MKVLSSRFEELRKRHGEYAEKLEKERAEKLAAEAKERKTKKRKTPFESISRISNLKSRVFLNSHIVRISLSTIQTRHYSHPTLKTGETSI